MSLDWKEFRKLIRSKGIIGRKIALEVAVKEFKLKEAPTVMGAYK